jgi:hypothetical protein
LETLNTTQKFLDTVYELLLKLYGQYFDSVLLKTELSLTHLSEEFLQSNFSNLLKYLIASNLNTALPELIKLSAFLLTIPTTGTSGKQSFSIFKNIHNYLHSTQTPETLTKLPLITEQKILQHLEKQSKLL